MHLLKIFINFWKHLHLSVHFSKWNHEGG